MAMEALLARYGLLAILVGAGIEGEAVVIAGGVLAHRGLVPLWGAMLCAAAGSCIVDQAWFLAGRRLRDNRRVAAIRAKPAFARALGLLERHPTVFVLGFRFVYGMRTVSPIAIGTSRVPARRFVPLNALAAAIWGCLFTLLGYWFGNFLDPLLHRLIGRPHVLALVAATLAIAGAAFWLLRRRRSALHQS
ncbi:DedA family protein [Sphingomonas aracearum]|uniref:DedA family protein n=1 Tax=Sphingomonas aracearum TaxID=2283317 RepID=A0A369VXC7_9SPHN|nr:DedA family protein [Sphingomonas aracearum]RDE06978.1 DedA family protein [Sphingomonas aracearum]